MSRFCTNCGSVLADGSAFCSNCGTPAAQAPKQTPAYSPSGQTSAPYGQASAPYGQQATPFAGGSTGVPGWKTDTVFSILGVVATWIFGAIIGALPILSLVYVVGGIAYALACYPKFFNPGGFSGKDPRLISFLNLFLGGIIFGCLWNHNLTRGVKGISHIVFCIAIPLSIVLVVVISLVLAGSIMYLGY